MADAAKPFVLLDVRNDDEYESWKLEGEKRVTTVHVPYFDFIEDEDDAMAKLPKDRDIVVVCAQGDSSEMVADMLNEKGYKARNVVGGMVAYGEYLQPVKVPLRPDEEGRFEIWQLNRRGKGCLSYVIRSGDEAILVDPSRHVEQYEAFLDEIGAKPIWVLDTHVHADHVSGGPALAAKHAVPYFVDAGGDFELRKKVRRLEDGEEIRLGGDEGIRVESPSGRHARAHSRLDLVLDRPSLSSDGRYDLRRERGATRSRRSGGSVGQGALPHPEGPARHGAG